MKKKVFVKHRGGGSLAFVDDGRMRRLIPGDADWVPQSVYLENRDKLKQVESYGFGTDTPEPEERHEIEVHTGQLQKSEATLPEWTMNMSPQQYLKRYGDSAPNSELAWRHLKAEEKSDG